MWSSGFFFWFFFTVYACQIHTQQETAPLQVEDDASTLNKAALLFSVLFEKNTSDI